LETAVVRFAIYTVSNKCVVPFTPLIDLFKVSYKRRVPNQGIAFLVVQN
jgi:hypothetical protein